MHDCAIDTYGREFQVLSQDEREVTILPDEILSELNRRLDSSFELLDLPRNLIIKHFDALFTLETAKFRIVRTYPPCRYLSINVIN